jgi:endoglucanase
MNWKLLAELCRVPGGPGREERVRAVVMRELKPLVDRVAIDRMGNVIATREPRPARAAAAKSRRGARAARGSAGAETKPRSLMLSAHMDEISFMVTHIDEQGFLRFTTLGGFDPKTITAQRVIVHGREDLLGVVGTKPVHVMTDEEKTKLPKLESYFVDLGLPKSKVEKLVRIGDLATRERDFVRVGDTVSTKSLDDRVGVFVMIEAMRRLKRHEVRVHAVASTQEEIGIRGAEVAARALAPDLGIALDVTLANDVPGSPPQEMVTQLGKGTAIKIMDSSVVCDHRVVAALERSAQKRRIAYQLEVLAKGGTDTAAIQRAGGGVPAGCISVPTRYVHSVTEMCHESDVDASIRLLAGFMEDAHTVPLDFTS